MADGGKKMSMGEMAGFAALGVALASGAGVGYCAWKLRETEKVAASAQRLAALSLKESDLSSIIQQALVAYHRTAQAPAPAQAPAQQAPAQAPAQASAGVGAEARVKAEEEEEFKDAVEGGGLEPLPVRGGKRRTRRAAKEEEGEQ